jgi:hypothetical protein
MAAYKSSPSAVAGAWQHIFGVDKWHDVIGVEETYIIIALQYMFLLKS